MTDAVRTFVLTHPDDRPRLAARLLSVADVEARFGATLEELESRNFPCPSYVLSGQEWWSPIDLSHWSKGQAARAKNAAARDAAIAGATAGADDQEHATTRRDHARERLRLIKEAAEREARERHRINASPSPMARRLRNEELRNFGLMAGKIESDHDDF